MSCTRGTFCTGGSASSSRPPTHAVCFSYLLTGWMPTRVLRQHRKMSRKFISTFVTLTTRSRESSPPDWSRLNQLLSHDRDGWSLEAEKSSCQISFYCASVCFRATPNSTLLLSDVIYSAGGASFSLDPVCSQAPVLPLHLYPGLGQ